MLRGEQSGAREAGDTDPPAADRGQVDACVYSAAPALLVNGHHRLGNGIRCPAGREGVALARGLSGQRSGSHGTETSMCSAAQVITLVLDGED